jgi:hypothetical protein
MNISLFKMALERLEPSDWAHFEQLCSAFLVPEFPNLRTMAHPSGDGGRDSELFSPEGKPFIAAQYSITDDWKSKIRQTVKRLLSTFPTIRILLYMSNRQIGGQVDELKKELLDQGISLDSRDRNWFIERASTNEVRESAAIELIDRIAKPYLVGEEIINKQTSPLTSGESRAALVYLGLQWQDDITDKGLTKLSFDALVRAALRHTHSEKRMSRNEIHNFIRSVISSDDQELLIHHVNAALLRLTKRYIRYWKKEDEFCLAHEEHQRILIRLAEIDNQEVDFYETVLTHCRDCLCEIDQSDQGDIEDLKIRIPRVIEKLLLRGGEVFVTAVLSDKLSRFGFDDLPDIVLKDLENNPKSSKIIQHYPHIIATTIQSLFSQPDVSTQLYLRRLSSSYTLLSFLNQTPDVQAATKKLFSHGTVWIDTTVLLPLIAEQLEDEQQQKLTKILNACRNTGTELRVTTGVIQEINAHMNNAVTCSQYIPGGWQGRVPYLYDHYLQTGQSRIEFRNWIVLFRGTERPEDDLIQFLSDRFDIKREDLNEVVQLVSKDLLWAADRLWSDAHKLRRRHSQQNDEATTRLLIQHDIETYLGVVALRQKEDVTELGYRHWLLTLDSIAWDIRDRLKEEFREKTPPSPLLSLSFLVNNMTFGPNRHLVGKTDELSLPLILDQELSESMPYDIVEIADRVRRENVNQPEHVIRRRVRDEADKARRRKGCLSYEDVFRKEVAEQPRAGDAEDPAPQP